MPRVVQIGVFVGVLQSSNNTTWSYFSLSLAPHTTRELATTCEAYKLPTGHKTSGEQKHLQMAFGFRVKDIRVYPEKRETVDDSHLGGEWERVRAKIQHFCVSVW